MTDEQRAQSNAIEVEAQAKEAQRNAKQQEFMEAALQGELAKFEPLLRKSLEEPGFLSGNAWKTPAQRPDDASGH